MGVTIDGKEPVTKEDLKKLELFVLAGVEVCASLINISFLSSLNGGNEPSIKILDVAITKAQQETQRMVDAAYQRLLKEHGYSGSEPESLV